MTPCRTRRPLDFDSDALLAALKACRGQVVEARRSMRPNSGLTRCADALIGEIDELALVLTGRRDFFHAPGHAAQMRGMPRRE
jgi:hypothetical protein